MGLNYKQMAATGMKLADALEVELAKNAALESENAKLLAQNKALHIALFHHPDERVRNLIAAAEAARGATP